MWMAQDLFPFYSSDLQSLARAAVSGDEAALDMFNWKKGKGQMRLASGPHEANCYFIGGNMGTHKIFKIYYEHLLII